MVMGCAMLTRPYPHPDLHIVELGKKKRRDGPFSSSFFSCQTRSHLGCSLALITPGRAREIKSKSKGIPYASLFGVGAPEALVIGVVALVVFGPKGLAEAARSLGKTLRAFQPTIREIQEVSREFKKTLEDEIGLNELASSDSVTSTDKPKQNQEAQLTMAAKAEPIESKAYSTEDYANITEKQAKELVQEEQLKVEPIESKAYSTEDYAEITEKQAKELVQEEQLRAEPIESKAYSTEDYANITEKQAKELVQEEQLRVEPIESKAYSTEEKQAKELVQEEQLRVSETKSSDGIDKNVE